MTKAQRPDVQRKLPQQARSRATVDAILFAAAHILKVGGLEAATTTRIAQAAGVSIGSLYQYFPNKQAILEALRDRSRAWYDEAIEVEASMGDLPSFRAAAHRALERFVAMHAADPELHKALSEGDDPRAGDAQLRGRELLESFLRDRLDEAPVPDPELTSYLAVRAMIGLVHGAAVSAP